jgi:hypothetical protein
MPSAAQSISTPASNIHITNKEALRWIDASRPGLRLAPVHENRETGRFLGLLGFDTLSSSGLHQHVDIGFSYLLSGGLTDYSGTTVAGQMGINLPGATHDAIAYLPSLMASRLDGPVLYWPEDGREDAPHLHAGGRDGKFENPRPEDPPDVSITLQTLPALSSSVGGVTRKLICDYKGTPHDFRNSALTLIPGTRVPAFRTRAPIEIFMIGGGMKVNGQLILASGFCVIETNTTVELSSGFGAYFIAWSEGPISWLDRERTDLFGF